MMRLLRYGWLWLLGYREVPFAVRGLFRKEIGHMILWGVVWGSLNGRYCGFIAAKSLNAPDLLVGLVIISIAIANLFAVWWGSLVVRRPARTILIPGIVLLSLIFFTFSLTPFCRRLDDAWGLGGDGEMPYWTWSGLIFAAQVMLGWIIAQAITTARTRLWRLNYPASHRARIIARFSVWQMLVGAATAGLIGAYFDGRLHLRLGSRLDWEWSLQWLPLAGNVDAYRILFPAAGVLALCSGWFYFRMPARREESVLRETLKRWAAGASSRRRPDSERGAAWVRRLRAGAFAGLVDSWRVLRADRPYRQYMSWQMLAGAGTMIMEVPIIMILYERFGVTYAVAAALLTVCPQLFTMCSTPFWARAFDRMPLLQFRVIHMIAWTLSRVLLGFGFWAHSLVLVGLGLGLGGLALGAGRFSWQLGHMAFSKEHNDSVYMGVHQALTGVRGLLAPMAGALLYRHLLGWHIVWLSVGLQALSVYGFARLHKREQMEIGPTPRPLPASWDAEAEVTSALDSPDGEHPKKIPCLHQETRDR